MSDKKNLCSRYAWFFPGMAILTLGVVIITKASLGTSPIASIPYVLSLKFTKISFGAMTFIMSVLYILLQILLLKKEFKPVQLLQIVVAVAFSLFTDLFMQLCGFMQFEGFLPRLIAMLIGCAIMAFGVAMEVAPNVLIIPADGMVRAIAAATGRPFHKIKVLFDVTMVGIALVLMLVLLRGMQGLGLGTLLSALLCGRFVGFYNRNVSLLQKIRALSPAA